MVNDATVTPELVELTRDFNDHPAQNNNYNQGEKRERKPSKRDHVNPKIFPSAEPSATHSTNRVTVSKKERLSVTARMRLKKLAVFWTVKLSQLLCVAYIMILTFSKAPVGLVDPASGNIIDVTSEENTANGVILVNGDYRPVVAQGSFQKFCLAMSRMSAFSMYPVMILVFLTKCKATCSFLSRTPLSLYMIKDFHQLHNYSGRFIAFDAWVHTVFHLLRWADQGNISLLWETRTGLTGWIVIVATPLITFPMMYWKVSIPYEIRKGLHYLFYVFAIGMCFHVPVSGIPNGGFIGPVLGFCICLYALDAMYVTLFMTEKIETTTFHVLPSGVQMTMAVSKTFQKRGEQGGFAYVCLPWVNRNQWHAFSLFENPDDPTKRQVFMLNTGDWTKAVHKALQRNTARPVWVQGPFPSTYNNAEAYDNQILVASGIGITPALSVIRAHKDSRRINLIWAVRDAAMLEFFLEHLYLDHDGWNLIFYTGKKPLHPALEELNTNVRVIKRRPNLHTIIPNIIYGIESAAGLPETCTFNEMSRVGGLLVERMYELDDTDVLTDNEKLVDLTALAKSHGFLFTNLVTDLEGGQGWEEVSEKETLSSSSSDDTEIDKSVHDSSSDRGNSSSLRASTFLERIRELGRSSYPPQDKTKGACTAGRPPNRELSSKSMRSQLSYESSNSVRRRMTSVLKYTFTPWKKNETAKEYVKDLDKNTVMSTWGILYCGGSKSVKHDLKRISEEYTVALNAETFAW